jgi:hypothetical protein
MLTLALLFSCTTPQEKSNQNKVNTIIHNCRNVYGSELIDENRITFQLRNYNYIWDYTDAGRLQQRSTIDTLENTITDIWIGDNFYRLKNKDTLEITPEAINKYKNSINSVFYFAFLPKSLTDEAVHATLLGEVEIKENTYYKIKVTFSEEGGGEDYEDIFLFWIHKNNYKLDYLAYQYFTEGGGMRFRATSNHHKLGDIILQDYNNYKPQDYFDDFLSIDSLFMKDELILVSRVDLERLDVRE